MWHRLNYLDPCRALEIGIECSANSSGVNQIWAEACFIYTCSYRVTDSFKLRGVHGIRQPSQVPYMCLYKHFREEILSLIAAMHFRNLCWYRLCKKIFKWQICTEGESKVFWTFTRVIQDSKIPDTFLIETTTKNSCWKWYLKFLVFFKLRFLFCLYMA